MVNQIILVTLCIVVFQCECEIQKNPNIVFIVANNLGWDDVGFHGSPQIPTPNIDSLALSGVILNNYYVSPSSFATKCEFMTGKYGSRLGVQHGVFHNKQATGLPENEKVLPQYLKDIGYKTHAIGKWGLGFHKEELLPWKRGFDTFFGGLTSSSSDYFTHSAYDDNYGLDLRRNEEIIHNETGHYATELYTEEAVNVINELDTSQPFFLYVSHQAVHSGNADDPLQVPENYLKKVEHIKNEKRKLYAGMVVALDESVLNITEALADNGLLNNTIVIFTTDSGGAAGGMELNSGSNYPLRGSKLTVWEGGVRAVAFVYSDGIQENGRVSEEMFHSTDWLPTILKLAGYKSQVKDLDGLDVWSSMTEPATMSPRFEILHQFDPLQKNQCGLRVGDYKVIINQDIGFYGDWYPRPAEIGELNTLEKPTILPKAKVKCDRNYPHPFLEMHAPPCDPMKKPCLFNIQWDPCEFHNLAEFMPNTMKVLLDRLQFYRSRIKKPVYPKFDLKADPENSDGVWGPWTARTNNHSSSSIPTNATDGQATATIPINATRVPDTRPVITKESPIVTSLPSANKEVHAVTQPAPGVLSSGPTTNQPAAGVLGSGPTQTPQLIKEMNTTTPQVVVPTEPAPTSNETRFPLVDIYGYEIKENNNGSDNKTGESYPISTAVQKENNSNPTSSGTNITTPAQPENNVLDIMSDQNDHVIVEQRRQNGSREHSNEYATILEDSVDHGQSSSRLDVKGKSTNVHIYQNETSPNPMETSLTINDLEKKRNASQLSASITDNTLAYVSNEDLAKENKQSIIYESLPLTQVRNETEVNETTGQENPPAASSQPALMPQPQPAPPLEPPVPVAPYWPDTQQKEAPTNLPEKPLQQAVPPNVETSTAASNPYNVEDQTNIKGDEQLKTAGFYGKAQPQPNIPLAEPLPLQQTAALRPNKGQQAKLPASTDKSLSLGTGSDTATSSESSVSSEANTLQAAKTDSKLPALQKPLVLTSLKNLADAGEKGKGSKQQMSSEAALVTGSYIGKGEGKKPIASNFVKEPEYAEVVKPDFEKPQNPFKNPPGESASSGTATSAGSETESETVVGSFGEGGSSTNIKGKVKGKKGPKLLADKAEEGESEAATAKAVNEAPKVVPVSQERPDSFIKPNKPNLGSSLKALSAHAPVGTDAGYSLITGQHNDLPNNAIAGHRPFSSVADVVSDSTNQKCEKGRNCIQHPKNEDLSLAPPVANMSAISSSDQTLETAFKYVTSNKEADSGTQAASNNLASGKLVNGSTTGMAVPVEDILLNKLPAQDKLHKFFGEIKVDDKKLFYISGTASEDKDLIVNPPDTIAIQNDVRKHNIGFNVMLPSTGVKQLTPAPKFKERSKIENATKAQVHLDDVSFVHPKNKSIIKKVFDMISDPTRTRKTKVEQPPSEEHIITSKTNIATAAIGDEVAGEAGDIGATKPLKGTLIESKTQSMITKTVDANDTLMDATTSEISAKNTNAGDLGSIVTLVGKVNVDHFSSKRTKHNSSDENKAHKKTVKDRLSVKHLKHNSSETNAANIGSLHGPNNSIIVSSVIVVLVASFVVVGMAVVAVVAVVAKHCRIGRHFEAS